MSGRAKAEFRATSDCLRLCWNVSAFTGVGASQRIGSSHLNSAPHNRSIQELSDAPVAKPDGERALPNGSALTYFGTVAQRICWRPARIFEPSRSCSDM